VTDPDQWDAAVQRFGRLDALVNNAGIVKMAPLRGSSLSDWQRGLDVNLTGAHLGMRSIIEPMIAGGGGFDRQHLVGRGIGQAALICTAMWRPSSAIPVSCTSAYATGAAEQTEKPPTPSVWGPLRLLAVRRRGECLV
jgi:NAD(P)-dependent dehydrogenase (short-subunit alcohol dehydrogenase family)